MTGAAAVEIARPRLRRAAASRRARSSSASRARGSTGTTSPGRRSRAARSRSSSSGRSRSTSRSSSSPDARAAMAVAADVLLRRADEGARGRRRHGHERQDDHRVPAARDPRRRRSHARARRDGRVDRRRRAPAAPLTTPEAIDLQRLFREMLDAGDRSVAVEASSHGSALRRLDRVRFDALVFTNLSQDHLDLHGTMEEYFQAKRRLFTGAQPPPAAVNVGDEYGRRLASELADVARAPLVTFGLDGRRRDPRPTASSWRRTAAGSAPAGSRSRRRSAGRFNVENVLGAVAAGAPARPRRRRDRGGDRARRRRARALRGGRRGPAVRRRRRLRAHAGLARDRAPRRARARRRPRHRASSAPAATATAASARSWARVAAERRRRRRSSRPTTRVARSRSRSSQDVLQGAGVGRRDRPRPAQRDRARDRVSPRPATSS